jgi:uncharacterized membrane protein YozB (DUF420 family)
MMDVTMLPTVNASLNGLSTVLLLAGYVMMKQKKIEAHRNIMVAAGVTSLLFLMCYVVYHIQAGSVKFQGAGAARAAYFVILISHVILAMVIAVLVPMTFWRAYKQDFERHRKIARITFPIWLYVSITGVVIYAMLYHLYAA